MATKKGLNISINETELHSHDSRQRCTETIFITVKHGVCHNLNDKTVPISGKKKEGKTKPEWF